MAILIHRLTTHPLHAPSAHLVKTAFGTMRGRQTLFVRIDAAGLTGWGESWVNFPTWSPQERRAAFDQAYTPYLTGRSIDDIPTFMAQMARDFIGPAQQAGTVGPLIASLCAVELALWDLRAKSEGVPLCRLWFPHPAERVRIYASGIGPPLPWDRIDAMLAAGVTLFKLKVGFGRDQDLANLQAMRKHLGPSIDLAVDANRAWTLAQAAEWTQILREFHIKWLEEPLRPEDEPHYDALHQLSPVPLAAGENVWLLPGQPTDALTDLGADYLQPDITKNCPAHLALELLKAAPTKVIPHYLGSAVGQAASLHLAAGCPQALVEWDLNPNPLRTDMFRGGFTIEAGQIAIPNGPGLGWEAEPATIQRFSRLGDPAADRRPT